MRIVVELELGNEAMQTVDEARVAIDRALERQAVDPLTAGQSGSLRDVNGNTVGRWDVVEG